MLVDKTYKERRSVFLDMDYTHRSQKAIERLYSYDRIDVETLSGIKEYFNSITVGVARKQIIADTILRCVKVDKNVLSYGNDPKKFTDFFSKLSSNKNYGEATINTCKSVLRAYLRHYNQGETPKGLKTIKIRQKGYLRDLKASDMITEANVEAMMRQTNDTQLKAMVAVQCFCGMRPGEFTSPTYGDVARLKAGFAISVNGKTGRREVIMVVGAHYLSAWLAQHPTKEDIDSLWVRQSADNFTHTGQNNNGKPIPPTAEAVVKRIRKIAKKASIVKPVDLYNLRHSCAVILGNKGVPDSWVAQNMGHSIEIHINTYGRLQTSDKEKRIYQALEMDEEKKHIEKTHIRCEVCVELNDPKATKCIRCGSPLTIDAAIQENKKHSDKLRAEADEKISVLDKKLELFEKILLKSIKTKTKVLPEVDADAVREIYKLSVSRKHKR